MAEEDLLLPVLRKVLGPVGDDVLHIQLILGYTGHLPPPHSRHRLKPRWQSRLSQKNSMRGLNRSQTVFLQILIGQPEGFNRSNDPGGTDSTFSAQMNPSAPIIRFRIGERVAGNGSAACSAISAQTWSSIQPGGPNMVTVSRTSWTKLLNSSRSEGPIDRRWKDRRINR